MAKLGFTQQWIYVVLEWSDQSLFLYYSMVTNYRVSNQQEVLDKVVLSHPIYFYQQQRSFHAF
jgi:hypothetical protein